jgi:hypothetical protein
MSIYKIIYVATYIIYCKELCKPCLVIYMYILYIYVYTPPVADVVSCECVFNTPSLIHHHCPNKRTLQQGHLQHRPWIH